MNVRAKRLLPITGATAIAAIAYASTDGFDEQLPGPAAKGLDLRRDRQRAAEMDHRSSD